MQPSNKYVKFLRLSIFVLLANLVIESFLNYRPDRSTIIILQASLNIAFFFWFFNSYRKLNSFHFPKISLLILLITVYFLVLGIFSSDVVLSYNMLLKFLIPLGFLIIGYNIFISDSIFFRFIKKSWILLAYFTLYILVVNAFNIGISLYREGGILIGYGSLNFLYIPTFSVLLIWFFFSKLKTDIDKILSFIFVIAATLIVLILLKRTFVLILLFGGIFLLLYNFSTGKFIGFTFILIISVVLISNFNEKFEDFNFRGDKLSLDYDLSNESRFIENTYIYSLMKDSPIKLVFGTGEVFNDRTFLSEVMSINRQAHNSFIRIFWSGGGIGLILFLLFYFKQFADVFRSYRFSFSGNKAYRNIFYFGIVFILLRFFNEFSSGITYFTFNAFSYLVIGGILRLGAQTKLTVQRNEKFIFGKQV